MMYESRVGRVVLTACCCSLFALAPAPLEAGVVMRSDGASVQCLFDPAQALTLSTASGPVSVKLSDVVWVAGGDKKRIRRTGVADLLAGSLAEGQVACYKSVKDRQNGKALSIPAASIIFLSTDDVEVKKGREMRIEESNGGRTVTVAQVSTKDFFVELLPENWSSPIRLLEPDYPTSMPNTSTLTVRVKIRGDATSLTDFSAESTASGKMLTIKVRTAKESLEVGKSASDFLSAVRALVEKAGKQAADPSSGIEAVVSIDFGTPFRVGFGNQVIREVTGGGTFLMYVDGGAKETYANNRLSIVDTVSNIQRLPIVLSR